MNKQINKTNSSGSSDLWKPLFRSRDNKLTIETEVIKCIRNTNSQLKISSKKKCCQKLVFVCLIFFNKHWRIQSSVEGFLRHDFQESILLPATFPPFTIIILIVFIWVLTCQELSDLNRVNSLILMQTLWHRCPIYLHFQITKQAERGEVTWLRSPSHYGQSQALSPDGLTLNFCIVLLSSPSFIGSLRCVPIHLKSLSIAGTISTSIVPSTTNAQQRLLYDW